MTSFIPNKTIAKSFREPSPTRPLHLAKQSGRQKSILPGADLKPRVKASRDGITKEPPIYFSTRIGLRRVPRRRYPLRPSPEMIQNARRGKMSNFLRSGKIIRASALEPMVDMQTAKLNLTDDIVLETDYLSEEDEQFPESQRKKENHFYITVKDDELPSYHFWKDQVGSDPIDTYRGFDWNQILRKSPAVQEVLADLNRRIAQRKTETGVNPKSIPTVHNAWTKAGDGELYRETNPKRDSHLRSRNVAKSDTECQWRPEGVLLGIPFNSSNQRNTEDFGQFGPQPGDPDWESFETIWEQKLETLGIEGVLREYLSRNPDKFSALRYGTTSSKIRPAQGDDQYARQFNDILKTAVPTVAFKLTQQTFKRPVSPINSQEPLVRGKHPKGWDLGGDAENFDSIYEVVHREEEELEFLDFYNEKSHGGFLPRRRKSTPEEFIHRKTVPRHPCLTMFGRATLEAYANEQEPIRLGSGLQSAHATYSPNVDSSDEEVKGKSRYLVQGRRGCLYIDDISYHNFCETAHKVIACDGRLKGGERLKTFSFDVHIFDDKEPQEYQIKNCSAEPPFFFKIFAALRKPLVQIRVADTIQGLRTVREKLPGHLKVTAPGIGHRYVFVRWNKRKDLESNSIEFINSAVDFLFPQGKKIVTKSETFRIEEVNGLWLYDLDLQSGLFLNEGVQRSFSEITGMEEPGGQAITHSDPEICIYKTTDNSKQQRAIKERERPKMAQAESPRQISLVHEARSKGDKTVVKSLMEPQLRAFKDRQASRTQPESVYNNPSGRIGIPKYGPGEPAIHGGPDFPTIYARVLTLAEIEDLQKQLQLREKELLQRKIPRDLSQQPGLRPELIERTTNEESSRQARNNEHQHFHKQPHRETWPSRSPSAVVPDHPKLLEKPLQSEVIRERRRGDTNRETNQSRDLNSTPKIDNQPQTETWPSKSPSAVVDSDDSKLPEKAANAAYYCNVCLINTTRFSLDRKKAHAETCSATIGNTLTLTKAQAAAAKKQKSIGDEKSKTEPVPPDTTTKAVQTGNLQGLTPLKEVVEGSGSGSRSTRSGGKRKSTMIPIDGAKKVQKKSRR